MIVITKPAKPQRLTCNYKSKKEYVSKAFNKNKKTHRYKTKKESVLQVFNN